MFAVGLWISGQAVWAQSAVYHLERLQIQARVVLDTLEPVAPAVSETTSSVAEQLEQSTSNSVWSRQMVRDDVSKILQTGEELSVQLGQEADPDELLAAKSTLESLARRLRVSSAALTLSPQSRTAMDFLMLELAESSKALEGQRDQILAQQRVRRARVSLDGDFGYGFGYWGAPLGWGTYYPYGNPFGPGPFYSGFPPFYGVGPGCR
jgi:hypothetical protein